MYSTFPSYTYPLTIHSNLIFLLKEQVFSSGLSSLTPP
jgi:hypothetical protein